MKKIKQRHTYKGRLMWKVHGINGCINNDKNLYMSLDQAEMNAPEYAFLQPVDVIEIQNKKKNYANE